MNFADRQTKNSTRGHKLNLTPMIDVVFLLIIFFMVVSQFSSQERTAMNLPKAENSFTQELASEQAKVIINIPRSGIISVGDQVVSEEKLAQILSANTDSKIIIRSDKNGRWSEIKPVLAACRKAGIATANIAVQKNTTP